MQINSSRGGLTTLQRYETRNGAQRSPLVEATADHAPPGEFSTALDERYPRTVVVHFNEGMKRVVTTWGEAQANHHTATESPCR